MKREVFDPTIDGLKLGRIPVGIVQLPLSSLRLGFGVPAPPAGRRGRVRFRKLIVGVGDEVGVLLGAALDLVLLEILQQLVLDRGAAAVVAQDSPGDGDELCIQDKVRAGAHYGYLSH